MIKSYQIGGELRPVKFGFNALRIFGNLTGLSVVQMETLGTDMSMDHLVKLVYCGLVDGARVEKKEFPFLVEDVADWLDEDKGLMIEMFTEFAASMAQPQEKKAKKKP
jgi:hypothetical protein